MAPSLTADARATRHFEISPRVRIKSGTQRRVLQRYHAATLGDYAKARRVLRRPTAAFGSKLLSIAACVRSQIGTAASKTARPTSVNFRRRIRRSVSSAITVRRPRLSSGFKLAVKVVRSIASSVATDPIEGGSGRLSEISNENCPLLSPAGRKASSNRRASARAARCVCRHRQWSRTSSVVS